MRRKIALWMTMVMVLSLLPMGTFADEHRSNEGVAGAIAFTLGEAGYWMGNTWMESDATPYIQADRIMVPVAHASRALGAEVLWKAETKEVEVHHNEDTYTLTIGNTQLQKNGDVLEEMDTIPVIQNIGNGLGRTMLPVSRLAKVLNVAYTWDAETKTATFMPMAEEGPVVFDEAGTYGPEEDTETIDNDVIISADGVILQNMVITGNLTITEAVGDGDVALNNITVEGDTLIQGGGTDSIHINGGSYNNIIVQRTPTGAVRVVVTGQNRLNIEVDEEADEQILILEGFYDKVIITAPNVRIITRGETQINELIITGSASNTTLETSDDTTIEKAVVDAEGTVFEGGTGTVKELDGREKENLEDKDEVVVKPPVSSGSGGGGGGSSPIDEDDDEEVGESSITNAEVDITSGSIVFGYTFYDGDDTLTYLEATQAPYYLDAVNSHVYLISGGNETNRHFQQMNVSDDSIVTYNDVDAMISAWWTDIQNAFVPEQICIYLVPTEEGNWNGFDITRDLTEEEKTFFVPESEFAGGTGTAGDPFLIATAEQLNNVRNYLGDEHSDKHFRQMAPIDLGVAPWNEDEGWEPIGDSSNHFTGKFDGNGQKTQNLTISRFVNYQGLFGYVGEGAKIKNVYIEDAHISGRDYTGGLAGFVYRAEISRSYTTGSVSGQSNTGGLIGYHDGNDLLSIVRESYSTTSVVGTDSVGGLVGNNFNKASIYDSYATGQVESNNFLGGVVGRNNSASVHNSYSTGPVRRIGSSTHDSMGGLVGFVNSSSVVEDSFWDTETSEQTTSKGGTGKTTAELTQQNTFDGWDFSAIWTIEEGGSYPYFQWQPVSTIPYPPSPFAGGSGTSEDPYEVSTAEQLNEVRNYLDKHFIQTENIDLGVAPWNVGEGWEPIGDYIDGQSFKGVYDGNDHEIDGLYINRPAKYAVGLFREMTHGAVVKNLKLRNVNVTGRSFVGAVSGGWGGVGYENSLVVNVHVSGTVTGTDDVFGSNVGGLVGTNSTIRRSSSSADVHGHYAGGLVGNNRSGHSVEESYATGTITGIYIGGLVGHNNYGTIQNSFSLARVNGNGTQNGGVIGVGYHSGSVLSNVFAAGLVDSGGGLIGVNHNGGTNWELSSYWDKATTGCGTSANSDPSFGKTTDAMKKQSTYDGWNFTAIWGINPDENSGYPFLRWQGFDHVEPASNEPLETVTQHVYEEAEFTLTLAPEGTFPTAFDDSGTATVDSEFWVAQTEVTYELWHTVYQWALLNGYTFENSGIEGHDGTDGSPPTISKQEPVTNISWRDMVVWINALSEVTERTPLYRNGSDDSIILRDSTSIAVDDAQTISGNGYRLPTSYEWELAAKWKGVESSNGAIEKPADSGIYWTPGNYASGATAPYTDASATQAVAWYNANSGTTTKDVKLLAPNALQLFDMNGNVDEVAISSTTGAPVRRGGNYNDDNESMKTFSNNNWNKTEKSVMTGFRLVRDYVVPIG